MSNKIEASHHKKYRAKKLSRTITADKNLTFSKKYFQALTENRMDVILVLDADLNITYKSASFERAIGSSRSNESNPYNFVHPDDLPSASEAFGRLLENPDEPLRMEIRGQHRNGSWRYFEVVATNLLSDSVVQGIVVNFHDITEHKVAEQELEKAHEELELRVQDRTKELSETVRLLQHEISEHKRIESALQESEIEYSTLVRNLADAVFTFKEGKLTWDNDRIEEILGFTKEEFIGADVNIFMPADDILKKLYKNVSTGFKKSGYYHGITPVKRKDNNIVDIEYTASIIPGTDPVELVGTARDITERRIVFQAVQESEKRYRLLAENVTDVIWIMDTSLSFTYMSPSVERLRGYTADEAVALSLEETVTPHTLENGIHFFTQLMSNDYSEINNSRGNSIEVELYRKDGSTVWTETMVSLLRDDNDQPIGILGVTRDNTERRIVNEKLQRSAQQILALQEIIKSFQSTLELRQILLRVAEAVVNNMAFDHSIVILKDEDRDINCAQLFHTRGGSKLVAEFQEMLNQTISTFEYPIYRGFSKFADDTLDKKVTITNLLYDICKPTISLEDCNAIQQLLQANMVVSAPIFFKDKYVGNIMVFTENDTVSEEDIEILKLVADHSGVAIENAKLNQELEDRISQRTKQLQAANKELEDFAYSLAHDLRTPLRGIDGFSQVLIEDYSNILDELGKSHLTRIRVASQHMAALIDDILHLLYVTRCEMTSEDINISSLVKNVADVMRKMESERNFEIIIEPGLHVQGDPDLIREVLENLFSNSCKFSCKRPVTRIQFGHTQKDNQMIYFVRDNGVGFDMAYVNKIFTAFQRLHLPSEFDGTGIGLATVQRIIRRHGGDIWAESEVDKGATFYFTIP